MPDHYFTSLPQSAHQPARFSFPYRGQTLVFDTDSGVFSRLGVDRGSQCLLNALPEKITGTVLDLGCGYGAIGLSLAKVWPHCSVTLTDVNQRAVRLAAANAQGNGVPARTLVSDSFAALRGESFDLILFNPPIRAGKQVIYPMFADAARYLNAGGQFWLVIRKQQGAASAMTYLQECFNQVDVMDKTAGYRVLRCMIPRTKEV